MSIADLKPDDFDDAHATYARWTLRPSVNPQGMWGGRYALWLEIESAGRTLLGYGLPDEALREAMEKLDELKTELAHNLDALRTAKGELPPNDQGNRTNPRSG